MPRQFVLPVLLLWTLTVGAACRTPDAAPPPAAPAAHERIGLADVIPVRSTTAVAEDAPRVLVVVAHPDDEIAFAGTLYKTATLLGGACDVLLITNGEGGFKYSTLAEPLYGVELTEEAIGRAELPAIREREVLESCKYLGVRQAFLLRQQDHRYTQDVNEVLAPQLGEWGADVWDVDGVVSTIQAVLRRYRHQFVLGLTPTDATHGHHQAATILALRAAAGMPESERPAVLCVHGSPAELPPGPFPGRAEFPETSTAAAPPVFTFDRTQPFGYRGKLNYQVIANWAIAAHKSQGTMQLLMNHGDGEHYTLFDVSPPGSAARCAAWFEALRAPQYPSKTYGPSAGARDTR